MDKKLIELRTEKNKRKPSFACQDSWKQSRLKTNSWRKPKGMHSKIRMGFRGNPRMPSPGYRSPVAVRGMDPSGLATVLVSSPSQLENTTAEAIIISGKTGNKKRLEIIRKAAEKKLKVLNVDAEKFTKSLETEMNERKKKSQKKTEMPAPEKAKLEKKGTKTEAAQSEEDKRKEAKREMEKIITKKRD